MTPKLRILRPSSREMADLLPARMAALQRQGFGVQHAELARDPAWTYTSASATDRASALAAALGEDDSDVILCARGGYGASDLLPLLPWELLRHQRPKLVAGFSDISVLHAALYTRLGWPGLHGPMPATTLWDKDDVTYDTQALLLNLRQWAEDKPLSGALPVQLVQAVQPKQPQAATHGPSVQGRLFGGCFMVLTNMIGTPYFPQSLAGHILFIEDTDENPARLMRAFNQWTQSGLLQGVQALVVGHLRNLGPNIVDSAPFVLEQFAVRSGLPVFHSPLFGHTSPNLPLAIGAQASIHAGQLSWHLDQASSWPRPTRNQAV